MWRHGFVPDGALTGWSNDKRENKIAAANRRWRGLFRYRGFRR
jgi:hypothetical protein